MKTQREMPFYKSLKPPKFAPADVIDGFTCYRDAVVWCWENRRNSGRGEKTDQSLCANFLSMHTPHMSRCVRRKSSAPMNLAPDLIDAFEAFCGWNAASQFLAKRKQFIFMEQIQEERRAVA